MYTYIDKRTCLFCGNPIPDQFSKGRKYCTREVLPDGSIKNCKDDYHSENNREIESKLRRIANFHKLMKECIEELILEKGDKVKLEDINRFGINLFRPLQFAYPNGMYKGWYIDYLIENTFNDNYKISKHDKLF